MRPDRLIADAACAAVILVSACASQPAAAPAWQTDVIEAAASALEADYIYEDRGRGLAVFLRGAANDYAALDSKAEFATALSADLLTQGNDRHLRLFYEPETGEVEEKPVRDAARAARKDYCENAPLAHRRLNGKVGYIAIPRFFGDEDYVKAIDVAMADLRDVSALILDVRNNCGGEPRIVRHFATYFFDERTLLSSTEMRGEEPRERWTLDRVPGPRFTGGRPLIILTNRFTFSAGESFTFGMKVTGRALTAGETTGGGGHFGETRRLSPDFTLFVPVGRTFDPRTGKGWEATGIAPDIEATSDGALDAALAYLARSVAVIRPDRVAVPAILADLIPDMNLRKVVSAALSERGLPLSPVGLARLDALRAADQPIRSLSGLDGANGLVSLLEAIDGTPIEGSGGF